MLPQKGKKKKCNSQLLIFYHGEILPYQTQGILQYIDVLRIDREDHDQEFL